MSPLCEWEAGRSVGVQPFWSAALLYTVAQRADSGILSCRMLRDGEYKDLNKDRATPVHIWQGCYVVPVNRLFSVRLNGRSVQSLHWRNQVHIWRARCLWVQKSPVRLFLTSWRSVRWCRVSISWLGCEISSFAGPQCDRRGCRYPFTSLLLPTAAWLESQMSRPRHRSLTHLMLEFPQTLKVSLWAVDQKAG